MTNSKFIQIFKTLSREELQAFQEYVISPFFNRQGILQAFLEIIIREYPHWDEETINEEVVFKKLYPKNTFNKARLHNILSDTYGLLLNFLAYTNYNRNAMTKKVETLTVLRKRELHQLFESKLSQLRAEQQTITTKSQAYFFHQYLIETEAEEYFSRVGKRTSDNSLQNKIDAIDLFYLHAKLKYTCELLNRKNILAVSYEFRMVDELIQYIKNNSSYFEHYPGIFIYVKIIYTLREPENESHYTELIQLLNAHCSRFEREEIRGMYKYGENYCIRKINAGNTRYLLELFELYKKAVQNEVMFEGAYLTQGAYKNIIATATRLKEFEWAENFVNTYTPRLAPELRENALTYNLATIYYSKGDFKGALKLLQHVEFTDVFYHLGAKSTLMKIYYDMDDVDSLLSLTDTFKVYLSRNKLLTPPQKKNYLNLIRFTRKLVKIKDSTAQQQETKKRASRLKDTLEKTSNVANVNWLLEKCTELC